MIDPRLEGKVVLITGANNPFGIGTAMGKAFAAPVDILVNNAAGYQDPDTIFSAKLNIYRDTFDVNVGGSLLMMAEFVRRFQAHGNQQFGRIINLSTDAAQIFPGQITYGASKATIEALTRSVAHEVGPLGITVNTIAPGPTQTGYIPKDLENELLPSIPLGRLGTPEDIADAAIYFASYQARWITGQVLKVSGGHAL